MRVKWTELNKNPLIYVMNYVLKMRKKSFQKYLTLEGGAAGSPVLGMLFRVLCWRGPLKSELCNFGMMTPELPFD